MSKETKETIQDILDGLKSGAIQIIGGHTTNSLQDRIEHEIKHIDAMREKYKKDKGMLSLLKYESRGTGRLRMEMQCFDCGETLYAFRIGDKIAYHPSGDYWDLAEREMGKDKFDFKFEMRHVKECAASHLKKTKMLTSTIELESGNVVFCNHFGKTPILDYPKGEYNSINSILGRDNVMQYLAKQNVGYGQMGNMSVYIYSNSKDEILVASDDDNRTEDFEYMLKSKDKAFSDKESIKNDMRKHQDFLKLLKDGKYKLQGRVHCPVWRWMCADDVHIKRVKAQPHNEGEKSVRFKVTPGKYRIEHFYDFVEGPIYSTMKPIK